MKFSEKLNRLINEAEEIENGTNPLILEELKNGWEEDFLDAIKPISESSLEGLAEINGYKVYGGYDYNDNALVINVKGRPNIDNVEVQDIIERNPEEIEYAKQDFAQACEDEFEGFTIRGRMGGYWGLSNLDDNITITEAGYNFMAKRAAELLQELETYKEAYDEAPDDEERKAVIYDLIQSNKTEIANALIENDNTLDIKPEFLERMNQLKERIDDQEKAWNDPEAWQYLFENDEESLEEDFEDDDFEDESFIDNSDKILSDEDIAAQYNDFKVESCTIEPSSVHDEWFNATLEIEFPNADHPDFNSSVIENVYYDRAADNWGFDNWYPDETIEKLKQIILDKIAEYEKEHENDTYLDNDYNPETDETTFTYKNKKGEVLDSITGNPKDPNVRSFYDKYHKAKE